MIMSTNVDITIYDDTFYIATAHGREGENESGFLPENDFVTFRSKLVTFVSAANNHVASVHIEVTNSAPGAFSDDNIVVAEGEVEVDGHPIIILNMMGCSDTTLSPPFVGAAGIRVSCHGRAEARRQSDTNELFFEGVERWHVQLWPLA